MAESNDRLNNGAKDCKDFFRKISTYTKIKDNLERLKDEKYLSTEVIDIVSQFIDDNMLSLENGFKISLKEKSEDFINKYVYGFGRKDPFERNEL